jgi:hypothetical protein
MKHSLIVSFVIVFSGISLIAQTTKKGSGQAPAVMTGYIVDQMCGKGMVMEDIKRSDAKAAKHTKECALDEACAARGYGLVSGGRFYTFDEQGNKKAAAYLHATKKEDNILVEVKGMIEGGSIKVAAVRDLARKKPSKK